MVQFIREDFPALHWYHGTELTKRNIHTIRINIWEYVCLFTNMFVIFIISKKKYK